MSNNVVHGVVKETQPSGVIKEKSSNVTLSGKIYNSHTLYNKTQLYYPARESGYTPQANIQIL